MSKQQTLIQPTIEKAIAKLRFQSMRADYRGSAEVVISLLTEAREKAEKRCKELDQFKQAWEECFPGQSSEEVKGIMQDWKRRCGQAEAACAAKDKVLESVLEVSPEFLDDSDGHFSEAIKQAMESNCGQSILDELNRKTVALEEIFVWLKANQNNATKGKTE